MRARHVSDTPVHRFAAATLRLFQVECWQRETYLMACLELTTVAMVLPPYFCTASAIQSPLPKLKLMTGTCSSIATLAFSLAPGISRVHPIPKGLSVSVRISRIFSRTSLAPYGPEDGWYQHGQCCTGVRAVVLVEGWRQGGQAQQPEAKMPSPPAFDTAATSLGSGLKIILQCIAPGTIIIAPEKHAHFT